MSSKIPKKVSNFIKNLQKEPKKKRKRIVLIVSLSITIIIAALWVISLPSNLSFEQEEKVKSESPSGTLIEIVKSSFGEVKERFQISF